MPVAGVAGVCGRVANAGVGAGCGRVVVGGAGCRGVAWAPATAGTSAKPNAATTAMGLASSVAPVAEGSDTSVGALTVELVTSVPLSKRSCARRLATACWAAMSERSVSVACCSVVIVLISVASARKRTSSAVIVWS